MLNFYGLYNNHYRDISIFRAVFVFFRYPFTIKNSEKGCSGLLFKIPPQKKIYR